LFILLTTYGQAGGSIGQRQHDIMDDGQEDPAEVLVVHDTGLSTRVKCWIPCSAPHYTTTLFTI